MGCCFSSTSSTKPNHPPYQPPILRSHKTPSPPQEDEEEAVIKEVLVLSETPKVPHDNQQENITQTPPPLPPPPPKTETQVSHATKQIQQEDQEQETYHISQQSEIYSVSETITTTTTTTATECLDEATSKDNSKLKHKSPAKAIKKRPGSTNGDPANVRARRESVRGRGRGLSAARTVQRNVGSRSRSPGTGRAGGVSHGAVGKTPATVTGKTDKKTSIRASATVEGQSKREEDGKKDVSEQQGSESIENPQVSLECFIFL
ncbi:Detected protein of unknown function [Hibiscus syriacus]|uniref:Uncharacterized protein n=1 Tax=Hibiscus syriacus TaxID=106335 RepID=A0A6A3D397_HIBSY|nr:Detected protein of unknown function [Hibiscus syriacus]